MSIVKIQVECREMCLRWVKYDLQYMHMHCTATPSSDFRFSLVFALTLSEATMKN